MRTVMHAITWINERLGRWILAYLVFVMFSFLLYEVFARYVFNAPTSWAAEATSMLFGVYVILSGGYLLVHHGHVNVDIFYAQFSPRKKAAIDVVTSVFFFAFTLVVIAEGIDMAYRAITTMEHSRSAWNPPVWPLRLCVPIGAGLLFLQGLVKLIDDLVILFGAAVQKNEALSINKKG